MTWALMVSASMSSMRQGSSATDRADGRVEHLTSLDSSLHDAGPTGHALASGQEVIRSRGCETCPESSSSSRTR